MSRPKFVGFSAFDTGGGAGKLKPASEGDEEDGSVSPLRRSPSTWAAPRGGGEGGGPSSLLSRKEEASLVDTALFEADAELARQCKLTLKRDALSRRKGLRAASEAVAACGPRARRALGRWVTFHLPRLTTDDDSMVRAEALACIARLVSLNNNNNNNNNNNGNKEPGGATTTSNVVVRDVVPAWFVAQADPDVGKAATQAWAAHFAADPLRPARKNAQAIADRALALIKAASPSPPRGGGGDEPQGGGRKKNDALSSDDRDARLLKTGLGALARLLDALAGETDDQHPADLEAIFGPVLGDADVWRCLRLAGEEAEAEAEPKGGNKEGKAKKNNKKNKKRTSAAEALAGALQRRAAWRLVAAASAHAPAAVAAVRPSVDAAVYGALAVETEAVTAVAAWRAVGRYAGAVMVAGPPGRPFVPRAFLPKVAAAVRNATKEARVALALADVLATNLARAAGDHPKEEDAASFLFETLLATGLGSMHGAGCALVAAAAALAPTAAKAAEAAMALCALEAPPQAPAAVAGAVERLAAVLASDADALRRVVAVATEEEDIAAVQGAAGRPKKRGPLPPRLGVVVGLLLLNEAESPAVAPLVAEAVRRIGQLGKETKKEHSAAEQAEALDFLARVVATNPRAAVEPLSASDLEAWVADPALLGEALVVVAKARAATLGWAPLLGPLEARPKALAYVLGLCADDASLGAIAVTQAPLVNAAFRAAVAAGDAALVEALLAPDRPQAFVADDVVAAEAQKAKHAPVVAALLRRATTAPPDVAAAALLAAIRVAASAVPDEQINVVVQGAWRTHAPAALARVVAVVEGSPAGGLLLRGALDGALFPEGQPTNKAATPGWGWGLACFLQARRGLGASVAVEGVGDAAAWRAAPRGSADHALLKARADALVRAAGVSALLDAATLGPDDGAAAEKMGALVVELALHAYAPLAEEQEEEQEDDGDDNDHVNDEVNDGDFLEMALASSSPRRAEAPARRAPLVVAVDDAITTTLGPGTTAGTDARAVYAAALGYALSKGGSGGVGSPLTPASSSSSYYRVALDVVDALHGAPPAAPRRFRVDDSRLRLGAVVRYFADGAGPATVPVTVVTVHDDAQGGDRFYTVRLPDGREKQTVRSRLALPPDGPPGEVQRTSSTTTTHAVVERLVDDALRAGGEACFLRKPDAAAFWVVLLRHVDDGRRARVHEAAAAHLMHGPAGEEDRDAALRVVAACYRGFGAVPPPAVYAAAAAISRSLDDGDSDLPTAATAIWLHAALQAGVVAKADLARCARLGERIAAAAAGYKHHHHRRGHYDASVVDVAMRAAAAVLADAPPPEGQPAFFGVILDAAVDRLVADGSPSAARVVTAWYARAAPADRAEAVRRIFLTPDTLKDLAGLLEDRHVDVAHAGLALLCAHARWAPLGLSNKDDDDGDGDNTPQNGAGGSSSSSIPDALAVLTRGASAALFPPRTSGQAAPAFSALRWLVVLAHVDRHSFADDAAFSKDEATQRAAASVIAGALHRADDDLGLVDAALDFAILKATTAARRPMGDKMTTAPGSSASTNRTYDDPAAAAAATSDGFDGAVAFDRFWQANGADDGALGAWVLYSTLRLAPSNAREWCARCRPRDAEVARRLAEDALKGAVVRAELGSVADEAQRIHPVDHPESTLELRVSKVSRELRATYRRDECAIEMTLRYAASHPLRAVAVEFGQHQGVDDKTARRWALQLRAASHQRSALAAVAQWRANVDLEFDGVEPCPICYGILHPKSKRLPHLQCAQCKNKFHASCLSEWFAKSHKHLCVVCQTDFVVAKGSNKNKATNHHQQQQQKNSTSVPEPPPPPDGDELD